MLEFSTVCFLFLVVIGTFVQTVSGFALGLVIILGATILDIEQITFSAAVISLISLVNSGVALRTSYGNIDRSYFYYLCGALFLGLLIGVILLIYLSDVGYFVLRVLLGFVVIIAGILLLFRPTSKLARSGKLSSFLFGFAGGVFSGLFSTGGSAWAYFLYRQPLNHEIIRATLLAVLAFSCITRTIMITFTGQMTMNIVFTSLLSLPIVVLITEVTNRNLEHIPSAMVRKLVVGSMSMAGLFLIFG